MERNFRIPWTPDPETTVSERIGSLDRETEDCLLMNPEKSILGFAAVRMELESFSERDIKYTLNFQPLDVRVMVKDILASQKEYEALEKIYVMSSRSVHRAVPVANYLSWGSWAFVLETLRKIIDNLDPTDKRLEICWKAIKRKKASYYYWKVLS